MVNGNDMDMNLFYLLLAYFIYKIVTPCPAISTSQHGTVNQLGAEFIGALLW